MSMDVAYTAPLGRIYIFDLCQVRCCTHDPGHAELKELSNDTKNVHIDKERQKLAIFGPCAIY
jgi:hypothetical protein